MVKSTKIFFGELSTKQNSQGSTILDLITKLGFKIMHFEFTYIQNMTKNSSKSSFFDRVAKKTLDNFSKKGQQVPKIFLCNLSTMQISWGSEIFLSASLHPTKCIFYIAKYPKYYQKW